MNVCFDLDVINGNEFRVLDLTQQHGDYIDESVEDDTTLYNKHNNVHYKYSESQTINIIMYNSSEKSEVVDVKVDVHDNYLDETYHTFDKDGYYTICHIVLPTKETIETFMKDKSDKKFERAYYIDECEVYQYGKEKPLTKEELSMLVWINDDNTNISRAVRKTFVINKLYKCYIDACKALFNALNSKCASYSKTDTFNRDFIWMTVNIIKYYVDFGQYHEAQRILEEVNYCNGLCKEISNQTKNGGCGCGRNK